MWGGRFQCKTDEVLWRYNASISLCKRLWREDIKGSKAYAKGLAKIGILSPKELSIITEGLIEIEREWETGTFELYPSDEDIHTAVERRLCEIIPKDVGGKLHTARSRNDQVQTDVHLWIRTAIEEVEERLKSLIAALCTTAERER